MTADPWQEMARRLACALEAVLDSDELEDGTWAIEERDIIEANAALLDCYTLVDGAA